MLGNECSIQTSMKLSYLLQMLIRSSKFLTVIMSVFLFKTDGHEEITRTKIFMAIFFTTSIFVFHLGDKHTGALNETFGFILGMCSLLFDCFVSHFQTKLRKKTPDISYWEQTQCSYFWCLLFAIIFSVVKGELGPATDFIQRNPRVLWDLFSSEFLNSISLLVIFYYVYEFGSVSMAKVASIRKSMSILCSIVIFGHVMNDFRKVGLGMISIVFVYEAYLNVKAAKPKVKTE